MRVVAWNCSQKFATNLVHLLELDFDVAVVAESAPLEVMVTDGREVTGLYHAPVPPSPKCIGVLARAPWRVSAYPGLFPQLPWLLPAVVTGPVDFTVLAVWPVAYPGAPSYPGQLARVLDEAFPGDGSPVVLAGDLNAPIASTLAAHLRNVQRLDELGLHSGFLASRGLTAEEAHGGGVGASAPVATYYQHRRRELGFHIDHIFVPKQWPIEEFEVAGYDAWVGTGRSDHVPLVADITVPIPASAAPTR